MRILIYYVLESMSIFWLFCTKFVGIRVRVHAYAVVRCVFFYVDVLCLYSMLLCTFYFVFDFCFLCVIFDGHIKTQGQRLLALKGLRTDS